jgi:hypothetical protein
MHIALDTLAANTGERRKISQMVDTALSQSKSVIQRPFPGRFEVFVTDSLFATPHTARRSISVPEERRLFLLYDGTSTPTEQLYFITYALSPLIAAHTLGSAASPLLAEGLAVHASGRALKDAAQGRHYLSLNEFCAALQAAGVLPSVADSPEFEGHLGYLDHHLAAGCFVGYLIETEGTAAFNQLYPSGDYGTIYGKSLEQLESEWVASLRIATDDLPVDPEDLEEIVAAVNNAYQRLWTAFEGTPAQVKAYKWLDQSRVALRQGRLRDAQEHLQIAEDLLE